MVLYRIAVVVKDWGVKDWGTLLDTLPRKYNRRGMLPVELWCGPITQAQQICSEGK
jgi:hypothetical protein